MGAGRQSRFSESKFLLWDKFTWQKAIIHFTRLMGAASYWSVQNSRTGIAGNDTHQGYACCSGDDYKAQQVSIQIASGEAWMLLQSGNKQQALQRMREATAVESKTEKHPVTPAEVLPAAELAGDMLMELKRLSGSTGSIWTKSEKTSQPFQCTVWRSYCCIENREHE